MTQLWGTTDLAGLSLGLSGKREGGLPESLLFVGTGKYWVDLSFGLSSSYEEYARLVRLRAATRLNELYAEMLGAFAAESGALDYLLPETPEEEIEVFGARSVPPTQAKEEIIAYIKENPGKDALEVALALKLDPSIVFEICDQLLEKGELEIAEAASTD